MNRLIISTLALGIVLSLPACSLAGVAPSDLAADEQTQITRAVEQTLAAQAAEPLQSTPDPADPAKARLVSDVYAQAVVFLVVGSVFGAIALILALD